MEVSPRSVKARLDKSITTVVRVGDTVKDRPGCKRPAGASYIMVKSSKLISMGTESIHYSVRIWEGVPYDLSLVKDFLLKTRKAKVGDIERLRVFWMTKHLGSLLAEHQHPETCHPDHPDLLPYLILEPSSLCPLWSV